MERQNTSTDHGLNLSVMSTDKRWPRKEDAARGNCDRPGLVKCRKSHFGRDGTRRVFFFIFSPLLPPGQDLCVGLDQTYQLLVCQVVSVLVNGLANKDDFEKKGRSKIQKRIPKTYPAEGLFDGSPRS